MDLILEFFFKCLFKCLLTNFLRPTLRTQIHEHLKMCSYAAEVFSAVLSRMRFLTLNARSRAPEFAYIHARQLLIRARNRSDVCSRNRPNPRESNSKASYVKAEKRAPVE